ncbi:MAG: hypothetical protein SFY32_17165 [Bacteroidota bacterium]|nr:hypothetical protein [Bacteroidota bacterium]
MKKDIYFPKVEGISVAVIRKFNEANFPEWYVYLINNNDFYIHNVIVTSRGYGEIDGEQRGTSTLRQHFDGLESQSFLLIEPIDPSVFPLYNEYWVSYYIGSQIYDKRFTFVPESIVESNLMSIDLLNMEGILHK